MKWKWMCRSVLMGCLVCLSMGCGQQENTEETVEKTTAETAEPEDTENDFVEKTVVDYEQIYESLLEGYAQLILTGEFVDDLVETGGKGVQIIADIYPASTAASMVGYQIKDTSGDGIPELLIGGIDELRDGKGYGTQAYAVYTCEEQTPVWSFGSYERTSYRLIHDGRFFYQGSGGAAETCFGSCHLSEDGRKTIFDDFYFSSGGTEISYYHNVSGEWDKDISKEMDSRSFWAMESAFYEQLEEAELIPFSQYMDEYEIEIPEKSIEEISVHAGWWDDTCAVFETNLPVQDFSVLTLDCESFDENGMPVYSIADELNYGSMVVGEPIFVNVGFIETIPTKGISYVDSRGVKRYYVIGEDGYDGSLFLEEININ